MSGMRKYIYLNRRPRPPQNWQGIKCKILNFCIECLIWTVTILLAVLGILALYFM